MDTRFIEVRKNITIPTILNLNGTFSFFINTVDFIPDEMHVKCITYSSNNINVEDGLATQIYTDLVSDVIGSFYIYCLGKPDTIFTLKKPVKGLYNFTLLTLNGAIDNIREGQLVIHLEFVKYRTSKSDEKIF